VTDKTWTDHAGNAVRTLSSGIYTDHVFTEDGKEIAAITLGSSTDGEGKISLTLYNKEGKTTHTISQPVIDGDSITTGKDTIINETAYDVNGNESAVTDGNGNVTTYTYDAENRLSKVSVTDKDGKTAVIQQNRYNGDGQRIQKVEGSKTTNYYYQDGVVSYTTDGENSQTSQNLIGTDGNILATQRYGSDHTDYLLYHKDIQGSSTSLVKEDGSADATYQYTDFGETTINGDNKVENEVCYTGGIYDQSTGLYYLNARYYNPEDGRFVTEDTYRGENDKPDTQHLYVYCANNPINHVDPSGHYAVALYTLVKVVAGGVVFYVSYSTWKRRRIKTRYAGRRVTFKTRISIWLTWRAANRIMHSKGKGKKKKQSKMSEKEKSSDTPSWADGHNPKAGENGNAYAKREMEKEDKDMNIVN
jgi:RHS repeat-associated protein